MSSSRRDATWIVENFINMGYRNWAGDTGRKKEKKRHMGGERRRKEKKEAEGSKKIEEGEIKKAEREEGKKIKEKVK